MNVIGSDVRGEGITLMPAGSFVWLVAEGTVGNDERTVVPVARFAEAVEDAVHSHGEIGNAGGIIVARHPSDEGAISGSFPIGSEVGQPLAHAVGGFGGIGLVAGIEESWIVISSGISGLEITFIHLLAGGDEAHVSLQVIARGYK